MRSVLAALLLALGLVVLGPSTAYACSCVLSTPTELLDRADVVVVGTVAAREPASTDGFVASVSYDVDVQRVYKGDAGPRLQFGTSGSSASCGLDLVVSDRPRVLFLSRRDGGLTGGSCGGTGMVTPAQVAELTGGEGTDPATPAPDPPADGEVDDPAAAAAVEVPAPGSLAGTGGDSAGDGRGPGGTVLAVGTVLLLAALATSAGIAAGALRRRAEIRG